MKTFKVKIYPTAKQREYLTKAFGIRRWVWNWAVAEFFEQAKQDKFPTAFDLQKQLNNTLVKDPEYSWLNDVVSMVRQESLKDLNLAIKAYAAARHEAKRTLEKCDVDKYKPHFKKKGKCKESCRWMRKNESVFKIDSRKHFSLTAGRENGRLSLKTAESVWFLRNAKICTCTISCEAGAYYASITYEKTNRKKQAKSATVGLDLGIKHPIVAFDGKESKIFDLPDSLKLAEMKREQHGVVLSRKQKGSKRFAKAKLLLEKAYARENNIKKEFREQLTLWLASNFDCIKIDDYSFASAMNLKRSRRAIHRVGNYEFKERLKAKVAEYNGTIVVIPKGTPTTQVCSACGCLPTNKVKLRDRVYTCEHCGFTVDRDVNSAINAFNY